MLTFSYHPRCGSLYFYFFTAQNKNFMKPLFFRLMILSCVWMILGSSRIAPANKVPTTKQTYYYWYYTDTDYYMEYSTTATAINDLEAQTAKLVNTQMGGGNSIANGYINTAIPHTPWPAVLLYTH